MAKKQTENVDVEVITPDAPNKDLNKKEKVQTKATKKSKKKEKGPNKLATKTKETISELKKVSWPSFKTVCKNTGIVISVVIICTLVLFGIDRLLGFLYTLIPG